METTFYFPNVKIVALNNDNENAAYDLWLSAAEWIIKLKII